MAETFNKRELEKKRLQKRQEKEQRKEERKANKKDQSFEDMIAYVDEYGNITSTPPDKSLKKAVKQSDISLTSNNTGGTSKPGIRQGSVKFYDGDKGYGFIKDEKSGEEFFFHFKSADFAIAQQDKVSFETERGPKGFNAVNITKI